MRKSLLILAVAGVLLTSLLFAGCTSTTTTNVTTSTPSAGGTSVAGTATSGGGQPTTIALTAQNVKFDKTTITVPAGSQVTVNFNNQDSGVPHNFAVYTDASAATSIFKGQIVNGPGSTTYTFTAPSKAGTYFFRCDVHPTTMTGQFIVT